MVWQGGYVPCRRRKRRLTQGTGERRSCEPAARAERNQNIQSVNIVAGRASIPYQSAHSRPGSRRIASLKADQDDGDVDTGARCVIVLSLIAPPADWIGCCQGGFVRTTWPAFKFLGLKASLRLEKISPPATLPRAPKNASSLTSGQYACL